MSKKPYIFPNQKTRNQALAKARKRAKNKIAFIEKYMHDPLFRKILKEEKMRYKKRSFKKTFFRRLLIASATRQRWLDELEKKRKQ